MGADSKIEWCDHTFNPWWGCQRVSPGCEHCYAETFSKRVGLKLWGVDSDRRFFGEKHWSEPVRWDSDAAKGGVRHRVFCASMADVFEDREDLREPRERLFKLIASTSHLDWLLLTKRPQNIRRFAPHSVANVWLGTTVEDQVRAEERIEHLLDTPAAVHFLSCEPLLGPVDLENVEPYYIKRLPKSPHGPELRFDALRGHMKGPDDITERKIGWVIVGGESGHGARPFALQWGRDIVAQCQRVGVPVFVKQLGADPIDGTAGSSVQFRDRKAGDWTEWPDELRVRQFPAALAKGGT